MLWSRLSRPDHAGWKPVANADDGDRIAAYEQAAAKLSIRIRVGYPVPCPVGADYAARIGHKGIYIAREQADREMELTSEMFTQLRQMSE